MNQRQKATLNATVTKTVRLNVMSLLPEIEKQLDGVEIELLSPVVLPYPVLVRLWFRRRWKGRAYPSLGSINTESPQMSLYSLPIGPGGLRRAIDLTPLRLPAFHPLQPKQYHRQNLHCVVSLKNSNTQNPPVVTPNSVPTSAFSSRKQISQTLGLQCFGVPSNSKRA